MEDRIDVNLQLVLVIDSETVNFHDPIHFLASFCVCTEYLYLRHVGKEADVIGNSNKCS